MNYYPISDCNIWGASMETQFSKHKEKSRQNCEALTFKLVGSQFSNNNHV